MIYLNILKDLTKQKELNDYGYSILSSVDESTLDKIKNLFNVLHKDRKDIPYNTLYTCIVNNDKLFKRQMHDGLYHILKCDLESQFINYKLSTFTFQIKGIGTETELGVHQDWSYSNEVKGYSSYTFWLPLIESDESNGTLCVVPKSHRHHRGYRGHGIISPVDGLKSDAKKYHIPLRVKAGELLIFDTSMIHYSPDNLSNNFRVSVMVNITNQPEGFSIYLQNNQNDRLVDEYLVPDNFFLLYDDFKIGRSRVPDFAPRNAIYENLNELISIESLRKLYSK
jgi:hypothetical protein